MNDFRKLPVSTGGYIKNNKSSISFRQSDDDMLTNSFWDLDIVVEVLGKYTDGFPVNISGYDDTNSRGMIINTPITKSQSQTDSSATDIAVLRNDFSNLLLKLKTSEVMLS